MSEERSAAVLRALEADLPPSTVDIDRAVRVGRRRERTRRGLAAGALAGVTVLAGIGAVTVSDGTDASPPSRNDSVAAGTTTATTAGSQACVATRLPGLTDGRGAHPGPMSPNGRLIAGETGDPALPLLWTDGAVAALTVPAGVTTRPHGVNDDGVVVGLARRNDRTLPFVVRDGAYAELPLPSGAQGVAHAINTRGDIVGEAFFASGDTKVVLWKAGAGSVTTLPSPAQWPGAHAIADDGTMFGSLGDGGTPYAWRPDGTGRTLPGPPGSNRGKAMGTAGDYVFGHAGTPAPTGGPDASKEDLARDGNEPRWVRWQLSTGTVVEVTGGLSASAVDATGAVVGSVRKGAAPNVTTGPARWRDGKVAELPGPDGALGTGGVTSTSRDGTRLAGWTGDANAPVPTVWRC